MTGGAPLEFPHFTAPYLVNIGVAFTLLATVIPACAQVGGGPSLKGKTLHCGNTTISFNRQGAVVVQEDGRTTWRAKPDEVVFARNGFSLDVDAQDTFKVSYRYGEYWSGDHRCAVQ